MDQATKDALALHEERKRASLELLKHAVKWRPGSRVTLAPLQKINRPPPFPATDPCDPQQEARNRAFIKHLQDRVVRLNRITSMANAVDSNTTDFSPIAHEVNLDTAIEGSGRPWSHCAPSFAVLWDAFGKADAAVAAAEAALNRAVGIVMPLAEAALQATEDAAQKVLDLRVAWDVNGTGGPAAVSKALKSFETVAKGFTKYVLVEFSDFATEIPGMKSRYDTAAAKAYGAGGVTELDALRGEYLAKGIPVPPVTDFTTSKRSKYYDFAQLNTGDFPWAILTDELLDNIDTMHEAMTAAGYQTQINSVYRNPFRSNGLSRHQYGRAVDWQVFDFDGSGGRRDKRDWKLLYDLFEPLGGWREPLSQSGAGHVHIHFPENKATGDIYACGEAYDS